MLKDQEFMVTLNYKKVQSQSGIHETLSPKQAKKNVRKKIVKEDIVQEK